MKTNTFSSEFQRNDLESLDWFDTFRSLSLIWRLFSINRTTILKLISSRIYQKFCFNNKESNVKSNKWDKSNFTEYSFQKNIIHINQVLIDYNKKIRYFTINWFWQISTLMVLMFRVSANTLFPQKSNFYSF